MAKLEDILKGEQARFIPTAVEAFAQWAPDASEIQAERMQAGFSGAAVLNIDISTSDESDLPSGRYILKLSDYPSWDDQEDEATAHDRSVEYAPEYAKQHIPQLKATWPLERNDHDSYAMLYEIAGSSLDEYCGTDIRESDGFLRSASTLARDLLNHWCPKEPSCNMQAAELLREWLGYRVDANTPLSQLVDDVFGQEKSLVFAGEAVANPLRFLEHCDETGGRELRVFIGRLHGDLHGGNVLAHRVNPEAEDYWVIDFGLATDGPIGFDQSYMEVAQIMYCLKDHNETQLIQILKLLDDPDPRRTIPPGSRWFLDCLTSVRDEVDAWITENQQSRKDDLRRQFLLSRVAAGLNWANKKMSDHERRLALLYASWAAAQYLRSYEPKDAPRFWNRPAESTKKGDVIAASWKELWDTALEFAPEKACYVLIAEGLGESEDLRALGQVPWSMVVDLDPYSDESGLHRLASPVLEERRGVHQFGKEIGAVDMSRATGWIMASGWKLKREPATDLSKWRIERLGGLRQAFAKLEEQASPLPIYVLLLPGKTPDKNAPMERLTRAVDACWEYTNGRANFILVGDRELTMQIEDVSHIPISTDDCVRCFAQTLGTTAPTLEITVPGQIDDIDQPRRIPTDALRVMEENFHVLHSGILDCESTSENEDDTFWRGRPPTWFDIHCGVDIPRTITSDLVSKLRVSLEDHRNNTTILNHNPGAGGTTTAMRAAWELHWNYPTVVLHTHTEALPDRLESLYTKTGKPVLLVADSAVLAESPREDLYRELAGRNVRVVLLYLRRVFRGATGGKGLNLMDPMDADEAGVFLERFRHLTKDPTRIREMERITNDPELIRYRSPFFYGLVTFERDFEGTESYVKNHLGGVRGKARDILEYLALLTIYSNGGLNEVLVKRMLGASDQAPLSLAMLLGERVSRLVVSIRGNCRIIHQAIAEEILATLSGDAEKNWRLNLFTLARDFIIELASVSDPDSERVRHMLRQLFIERQGGKLDDIEDRQEFSPLIEHVDQIDRTFGNQVLEELTKYFASEPHFFNHLGRHQIYRLTRDHDKAVEYLEHAVKLSDGKDFIHWHTLGFAYRGLVKKGLADRSLSANTNLLERVSDDFNQAAECFASTRRLNPENLYGYITHIQMIVAIAKELVRRARVESVAELTGAEADWVREQMSIAVELSTDAQQLYGTLNKSDKYLRGCIKDLHQLYGNINEAIQLLSLALSKGIAVSVDRRSLAHAYLVRNDRMWSNMQLSELREIVSMMEQNLREPGRREEDYRLWFEAYKLLPEFNVDEAISQLVLWTERFPSWRAHYYMSVLHFTLWFERRVDNPIEMEEQLERCQKLFFGRKNASNLWFAVSPVSCPLQSVSELGQWNRKTGFWPNAGRLKRVNGFIESIKGAQAGTVKIDGEVDAFFVPGKEFHRHEHESKPVNFFVGFSAGGLRAWNVQAGHIEGGSRPIGADDSNAEMHLPAPSREFSVEQRRQRIETLQSQRVLDFARDFVTARTSIGATVDLADLEQHIEAVFGVDGLLDEIDASLPVLLAGSDELVLTESGDSTTVSSLVSQVSRRNESSRVIGTIMHAEDQWGLIKDTNGNTYKFTNQNLSGRDHIDVASIVDFIPKEQELGPAAINVRVLGSEGTLKVIQSAVEDIFEEHENETEETVLPITDLIEFLETRFPKIRDVQKRLGYTAFSSMLRSMSRVEVFGKHPDVYVRVIQELAFGRIGMARNKPAAIESIDAPRKANTQTKKKPKKKKQQKTGTVVDINSNGEFGFIKDGDGQRHWFSFSVWPKNCAAAGIGAEVEFSPWQAKQGLRARDITVLADAKPQNQQIDRIEGSVKYLERDQRFGLIKSTNTKKEYFFHLNRQSDEVGENLRTGSYVDFIPGKSKKGEIANEIRLLDRSASIRKDAIRLMRELLLKSDLKASALGSKVSADLAGTGPLAERLGVRKFIDFVASVDEFEVEFDGSTDPYVSFSDNATSPVGVSVQADQYENDPEHSPDDSDCDDFDLIDPRKAKSAVSVILAEEDGQRMKIASLGSKLVAHFPGTGKLGQRLKVKKFIDFVKQCEGVSIDHSIPTVPFAVLSQKTMRPATKQTDKPKTSAGKEGLREQVEDALVRLLQEQGSIKTDRLGLELNAAFPGDTSLTHRLGAKTLSSFIRTLDQVRMEKDASGNPLVLLATPPAIDEQPKPHSVTKIKDHTKDVDEVKAAFDLARESVEAVRLLSENKSVKPDRDEIIRVANYAISHLENFIDLSAVNQNSSSMSPLAADRAKLSLCQLYAKTKDWTSAWFIGREIVESDGVDSSTRHRAARTALIAGECLMKAGKPSITLRGYAKFCTLVDSLFPESEVARFALAALKRVDALEPDAQNTKELGSAN